MLVGSVLFTAYRRIQRTSKSRSTCMQYIKDIIMEFKSAIKVIYNGFISEPE